MDNRKSKVLIIDNNLHNGVYLSMCSHAIMPKSAITWLRIADDTEEFTGEFPEGVDIKITSSLEAAAKIIDEVTSRTHDLIIFYNLRLGHYQGNLSSALRSPITAVVERLVESKRKILVNVHSSDINTRKLAEKIDPSFKTHPLEAKVICHHLITGSQPLKIYEIVNETLDEWRRRNPENGIKAMGIAS